MLPCSCTASSPSKLTQGVNQKGETFLLPKGLSVLAVGQFCGPKQGRTRAPRSATVCSLLFRARAPA